MAQFHYNTATEGIRSGHKIISILGLKWLTIEIIPVTPPRQNDIHGGGPGLIPDKIYPDSHYYIRVTIVLNGKKTVRIYNTKFADVIAKITLILKDVNSTYVSVFVSNVKNKVINKLVNIKNYVVTDQVPVVEAVTSKEINIKVKSI